MTEENIINADDHSEQYNEIKGPVSYPLESFFNFKSIELIYNLFNDSDFTGTDNDGF